MTGQLGFIIIVLSYFSLLWLVGYLGNRISNFITYKKTGIYKDTQLYAITSSFVMAYIIIMIEAAIVYFSGA